ncbi:tetratricopeptide repeat protein [Candidatus Poribacteria bacterium]|nr:tetratricopeptide repeat protein [Candidatus Poribacteria bacterium]
MSKRGYKSIIVCLICLFLLPFSIITLCIAQDVTNDEIIIQRYKQLLHQNPKEGSTFDRVYQFYLESAGLEAMLNDYQAEVQANSNDPNLHLILGHLYKRLGKDIDAVKAYQRAVELGPENYYPHFALGKFYASLRNNEEAIQSLTTASKLSVQAQNVPPEELTEIYKALGHAYFQRDKVDEAIQAWKKTTELDPDDIFARIEIAELFVEQELFSQAISQYNAIIQLKKEDTYRVCLSHREIGNIHEAKGDFQEAIKSFDTALSLTVPGNWLRKDLQHRIIGIFAADGNWEGLIHYYQEKLQVTPNEPELLGLLAAAYIENQQVDEGISTYGKGIELAPTDTNLRLNLIATLRNIEKFDDAAAEYEVLSEQSPDDFGIYRELGELYLQTGNQQKAKDAYQRMIDRSPNNPTTHLILAEIYTGHEWIEDAENQYEKAISLAPNNLDYIEYFGDFYLRQGNREKALEAWNQMVADEKATAANYDRLAQLLKAKHFIPEAGTAIEKAVELMPNEYKYREALAKYYFNNGDYDASLTEYTSAMKLAPNAFFAEKMDDKRIELYRRQGTLQDNIKKLETELQKPDLTAEQKFLHQKQIAKMYLKLGNITYALEVLLNAKKLKPNDVGVNRWLATVYNRQGRRDDANAIYIQLIEMDSANAREYHAHIAKSYLDVLDYESATTAAKQVIANSPRNPEGHKLLAQIAKQSKDYDAAIDSLRQAIRLRPEEIDTRTELAKVYKLSGKLQEAIAQYWRCWNLSDTIHDKLTLVKPLSEVYYDMGRRDEFEEKLKQLAKSNTSWVAPVLALAEIHRMEGDLPKARFQLAQGLNKQRENPELLSKLVEISSDLGDMQDALTYQQRLVKVDPDPNHQQKLGELLFDAGREQEAIQAWTKLLHAKNQTLEAEVKLAALLLRYGLSEEAFLVLERASEKISGTDAHLPLYRLGVLLVGMNEPERAQTYFHRILDMSEPAENTAKQTTRYSEIYNYSYIPGIDFNKFEISQNAISEIQSRPTFAGRNMQWMPKTIEEAQVGSLVHLTTIAQQLGKLTELIQHFEDDVQANPTDIQALETLARFYTLIQQKEKAQTVIEKLIDISPNDLAYQPLRLQLLLKDNLNYESVKKAIDDIPGLVPTVRARYLAEYATLLHYEDKKEDATKLIKEIEDVKLTDLTALAKLVDAFVINDRTEIAEEILINLPSPSQKQLREYRLLFEELSDAYIEQGNTEKAIDVLWTFLERTKPSTIKPRRVAALAQSSYYYYGYYNPINSSYPVPTAYFNIERLNYLKSIFREVWIRKRQETLYTKLQKQLDTANGRDRIYPGLALSYCYWWDANHDKARQILSTLHNAFSDDLTLKLNIAYISIQSGEYRVALTMLEDLAESEPRNRRQYYDLILQLAIHTGDTMTLREVMNTLLNSPISSQELYDISITLQESGFTQYAIATAKKAMTLAMTQANPNFLMYLGDHLADLGRGQDAAILAERALKFANRPDQYGRMMSTWNFNQANSLVGNVKEKKKRETKIIEDAQNNPTSFNAQLKLAMFYEGTNKIQKASEAFEAALKLRPKEINTRLRYVQMLERSGKTKDAIPHYKILLKRDASILGYNSEDAIDAFVHSDKLDELITLTKEIIRPIGRYYGYEFTITVARRCLKEQRKDAAIELFQKIIEVHPNRYYLYQELATIYADNGEPEKAIQFLTEIYEQNKTAMAQDSFELKVAEFHETASGTEKAIQYMREKIDKQDITNINIAYILRLADLYKKNEELKKLIAEYDAKLIQNPSNTSLLYVVARMKLMDEDIDGAKTHVNQLIDNYLTTVSTQTLYNLANACDGHELQTHILEAVARKLEQENSWAVVRCYNKLGEAYAANGELEKAQNAFRKMGNVQTMQDDGTDIYERRRLASTYMKYQMWNDAETVWAGIINDLAADWWDRDYAQRMYIDTIEKRGDLASRKQIVEQTQTLSVGMQRAIANELAQLGQVAKAISIYERIAASTPEDFESRSQLARLYTRLNIHEKASETWTSLLKADPENTKYQDGLVNSLVSAGKLKDALELSKEYIQADPEINVHYVRLAKLYADDDRIDEALANYEKSLELAAGDRQIHLDMANLYLRTDKLDAAENAYEKAIQFTTSQWERENTETDLINLYRFQGKLEDMLQVAEEEGTMTSVMQREQAQIYLKKGELQQSVDAFKKALDLTTDTYDRNSINDELLAVYAKLGENEAALEIFENTLASGDPYRSSNSNSATITYRTKEENARDNLISAYNNAKKLETLKTLFENKKNEDPENIDVLELLAKIYVSEQNYLLATDIYQKLLQIQPKNVTFLFAAGNAYNNSGQKGLAQKTLREAEKTFNQKHSSNDMYFLGSLATKCFEHELYDAAIKIAKTAIDNSNYRNSIVDILYEILAKSYHKKENYEEAVKIYQELANDASNSNIRSRANAAVSEIAKTANLFKKWIPKYLEKIERNPNDTNTRQTLAEAYETTEQTVLAVEQYEKLSELQPYNPQWQKKLGDLFQILSTEKQKTVKVLEDTALTLSGNRSFVEINDSETLDNITQQVTISFWMNPTEFSNDYMPIVFRGGEWDPGFKLRSYTIQLINDGRIQFASSPQDVHDVSIYAPPGTIKLNTWTHIAGVVDAKNNYIKLFINGIEISHNNYKGQNRIHKSELPLRIGWTHEIFHLSHGVFVGQIDEVRIWNIARTQEQIRADMNTQLNGDEEGLSGYWKFDQEKNGLIFDTTPNKNHGKRIGNAKLEAYQRPIFESVNSEVLTKAISAYKKAIALEPANYQNYDLLAKTYKKMDQIADVERTYRQALEAPLSLDSHESAVQEIIGLYTDDAHQQKRIAILEEMQPKMLKSDVLHDLLGNLYNETGNTEKAELAYTQWLKIRQKNLYDSEYYYRTFAEELLEKGIFPKTAHTFAKRAMQTDSNSSYYYPTTLAQTCIANKQFDDAIKYFKQAFSIASTEYSYERIWDRITDSSRYIDDKEKFKQMLDELLDTFPDESSTSRANGYRKIAHYYSNKGEKEKAINYTLKAGLVPETNWITLGPFDNTDAYGVLNAYIPEETTQIDTTAQYYGKRELIGWEKSKYRSLDGHYVFTGDTEWSASYVWATVVSPDERDIIIRFDSDDQGAIWLNGKQVFRHGGTRAAIFDRYTINTTLKHGENTILVKICNQSADYDFYFRITNVDGIPYNDLHYKSADELLKTPPPEPTFHVNVNLGWAEYYEKHNMSDKAMEQMLQTGMIHEKQWLVLGPFDNTAGIGYDTAYIPEDAIQIDRNAQYDGANGKISWEKHTDDAFNGFIDFGRNDDWRVSYSWTTITSPDEREVQLRIGSDDQAKVWLNGEQVYSFDMGRWLVVDTDIVPVKLKAGENTILVKVCNEELRWGFYMRVTDEDGKPYNDLKINDQHHIIAE